MCGCVFAFVFSAVVAFFAIVFEIALLAFVIYMAVWGLSIARMAYLEWRDRQQRRD